MIEFPCQCGYRFSVPLELAGTSLQCPQCRRLNDIPKLSELASFEADGTYALEPAEASQGTRFGERVVLPTPQREPIPVVPPAAPARPDPKYDPITGELIEPIAVAPAAVLPVLAAELPTGRNRRRGAPSIGYATGLLAKHVSYWGVLLELFTAPNVVVMLFIFVFHLLLQTTLLFVSVILPIGALALLAFYMLAHYGCVVDEIGREGRDELPRPLRHMNWGEDLWNPFFGMATAFLLSYGPAWLAFHRLGVTPAGIFAIGALATAGTLLFPMLMLTATASGSILNLRPDRVLASITITGSRYVGLVLEWLLALIVYGGAIGALHVIVSPIIDPAGKVVRWKLMIAVAALTFGIYLMHVFCWHLALTYRDNGAQFPWVLQKHVKVNRRKAAAQRALATPPQRPIAE